MDMSSLKCNMLGALGSQWQGFMRVSNILRQPDDKTRKWDPGRDGCSHRACDVTVRGSIPERRLKKSNSLEI